MPESVCNHSTNKQDALHENDVVYDGMCGGVRDTNANDGDVVAGAGGGGGCSEHLRNTAMERAAQSSFDHAWHRMENILTLCKRGNKIVIVKSWWPGFCSVCACVCSKVIEGIFLPNLQSDRCYILQMHHPLECH